MAYLKERRPILTPGFRHAPITTVTASTGTVLRGGKGDYLVGQPSGNKIWTLDNPSLGKRVNVFVDTQSSKDISFQTMSSAQTFLGSTNDNLKLSTGQGGVVARFIGISTSVWAFGVDTLSTKSPATLTATTR